MDVSADNLSHEYKVKAKTVDRKDQVVRVESKLVELGEVQGIVCGNFGEVSQALHNAYSSSSTSHQSG